jgi:uncharacterized protein with von Willebrand factor type A (vWA) domain
MHEDAFAAIVTAFGHELRSTGVPVSPDRCERFARSVLLTQTKDRQVLYWLGRVTLLSDHSHVPRYDVTFERFFRDGRAEYLEEDEQPPTVPSQIPDPDGPDEDAPEPEDDVTVVARPDDAVPAASDEEEPDQDDEEVVVQISEIERLMDADFAHCTSEELALIRQLIDQIQMNPPVKLARRRKVHRRGSSIDIRRTLRRAQRTGGDPVVLVRRRSSLRPRRVVLLADVSGSMESYARVYLHLMRGAVKALEAEAFSFSTRLTRLTKQLAVGNPDAAYEHARAVARDWSGGTRIGQALEDFLRDYGRRGMARGSIIVIVSDGWETGDPQRITVVMEQLGRMAHRIIWVNPRKAVPGYSPVVAGMAAALPYVDSFVSGHSVRALTEVVNAISGAAEFGVR